MDAIIEIYHIYKKTEEEAFGSLSYHELKELSDRIADLEGYGKVVAKDEMQAWLVKAAAVRAQWPITMRMAKIVINS